MVNGLRLHYRDWGRENAPPLVLLHGWGDHSRVWDTVAAVLADDFRVLALDQRGHGESQWASAWAEYSLENKVADLATFVDSLGLAQLSLLGHSGGGGHPAFTYTSEHPERVRRLVIVDAGPGPRDPVDSIPPPAPFDDIEFTVQDFDDPEVVFAGMRALWTHRYTPDPELRHWFQNNIKQRADGHWMMRWDGVLGSPNGLKIPGGRDAEQHYKVLAKIACPTLIVRGEASHSTSRAKVQRMMGTIPDCRVVEITRATHYPHTDNAPDFLAAVQPFLIQGSPQYRR